MPRLAPVRAWFAGLPRWVRGVVGVIAVVLGVVVIARPTASLGLLAYLIGAGLVLSGVLELLGGGDREPGERLPRWRVLMAVLWIAGGVFVLIWPGLTVRMVALVVGIGLMAGGALSFASAFRRGRTLDARIAAALLGLAQVVFGVLALVWPDIALLIVAVVFGARLVIVGVLEAWRAVRGSGEKGMDAGGPADPVSRPGLASRWARTIAAGLALVLAVGAGAISIAVTGASPVIDHFYAAPRDVPGEPGRLVRAEPFTRGVPEGARAWRILYTTTAGDGSPAVASGLVVVPTSGADFPVVDWAHGTTGFAQQCAPSLLDEPFESGALLVLPEVVAQGWALVATDYIGLGTVGPHPYMIGVPSAHAVLDARRAASELTEASLGEQTVVWGHSQGGGAALWTGALADDYAPDVPLSGVVALAPAANLPTVVENLDVVLGGSIFGSFVIMAYTSTYDDVTFRQYVRPGAEVTVRRLASRCLSEPGAYASLLTLLGLSQDPRIMAEDPATGAFGERLRENTPPPSISVPVLFGQGAADTLITPAGQEPIVAGLCDAGTAVDYRLYVGRDHMGLVAPESPLIPQLIEWTRARFAGEPVEGECVRSEQ